eukprot:352927-Chlamydomonas_euryale.AAC.2
MGPETAGFVHVHMPMQHAYMHTCMRDDCRRLAHLDVALGWIDWHAPLCLHASAPDEVAATLFLETDGNVRIHVRVMPVDNRGLCKSGSHVAVRQRAAELSIRTLEALTSPRSFATSPRRTSRALVYVFLAYLVDQQRLAVAVLADNDQPVRLGLLRGHRSVSVVYSVHAVHASWLPSQPTSNSACCHVIYTATAVG